jgi:hypothetical protein
MGDKVQDFFGALSERDERDPSPPSFRLGVVDAAYTTGRPRILFDGDTTLGTKTYPYVGTVAAGNRVLCARAGHTWVVLGVIH